MTLYRPILINEDEKRQIVAGTTKEIRQDKYVYVCVDGEPDEDTVYFTKQMLNHEGTVTKFQSNSAIVLGDKM